MSTDRIVLRSAGGTDDSDGLRAEVLVDTVAGGRIRQITVADGDDTTDLLVVDADAAATSSGWGCFPMAPWAGRIRHGRFRFLGDDVHLDLNHADGSGTGGGPIVPPRPAPTGRLEGDDRRAHAIHGTTFTRPWDVVDVTPERIDMTCPLDGVLGWPYPGLARQIVTIRPRSLDLALSVEPSVGTVCPVTIGWHPWFVKPRRLDFDPVAMYALDDLGIPSGELIRPTPPPWDDCFINDAPVVLHYERPLASVVTVSSPDCDHWVVYDKPSHATCVEPQSGPPDAVNLRTDVATATRPIRRTMTIAW